MNSVFFGEGFWKSEFGWWVFTIFLGIFSYVVATSFITPGFFDPLVPMHSDVWRYYSVSQYDFSVEREILGPRPLMVSMIRIMGVAKDFYLFTLLVVLVAFLLPIIILWALKVAFGWDVNRVGRFFYFIFCYSLPSFYEVQMLDLGGCLSGIVASIGVVKLSSVAVNYKDCYERRFDLAAFLFFVWMSMEFKPTYGVVLLFAPFLFLGKFGWRRSVAISLVSGVIVFLVLLKDKLLGSPFVSGSGNYRIASGIFPMIDALVFHLRSMFPSFVWVVYFVSLIFLYMRRGVTSLLAFLALPIFAIAPMLAIPDSRFKMYSWFGALLALLPVVFFISDGFCRKVVSWVYFLRNAALIFIFIFSISSIYSFEPTLRYWNGSNHKANSNTLSAIEFMKEEISPGDYVLIAGPLNAYSPFRNDDFVKSQFPFHFEWRVVVPEVDSSLVFSDSNRQMPSRDLFNLDSFNKVFIFNRSGNLIKVESSESYIAFDRRVLIGEIFCLEEKLKGIEFEEQCLADLKEM